MKVICPKILILVLFVLSNPQVQADSITIQAQVFFDTTGVKISLDSKNILDDFVQAVLDREDLIGKVLVRGHTDDRGTESYNQALSEKRAQIVKNYLIGKKIPASMIEVIGHGEAFPSDFNSTAQGRAKNRRVELSVVPK